METNDPTAAFSDPPSERAVGEAAAARAPAGGGATVAASAWRALGAADRYGLQVLRARVREGSVVDWEWLDVNGSALELVGLDPNAVDAPDPERLRGQAIGERVPGATTEALLERLTRAAAADRPSEFEQYVPERDRGDGEEGAWFHVTVIPYGGAAGSTEPSPTMILVVSRAITEYKTLLRHAVDLMNHDDLTGLANRRLLKARFWVRRRREEPITLLYFDLNGFKQVNDTYGHETGDRVLEITAQRLAKNTRPDEIVARIGGDEFGVLLAATEPSTVHRVVRRLLRALEAPIHLEALRLQISAAVGIAYYPEDGETFDALMSSSDQRMYEQKRDGRRLVLDGEP